MTRYDLVEYGGYYRGDHQMDPSTDGEWVRYADVETMLAALKLVESVYRQNCVAVGEPSSVLDAIQAAIKNAEDR